jgi:uncharacterized protein (TIGR03435 family)
MRLLAIAALASLLAGQQAPAFEVASIRPTADEQGTQAGLQITQSQVRLAGLPLRVFISMAFKTQANRVVGPDWLGNVRFDINAKLPDGGRPDQVPEMLQTLLTDRFKMRAHRENRDSEVYSLEIGKGGLTAAKVPADRDVTTTGAFTAGGGGNANGVSVDMGRGSTYSFADNRFVARKVTMEMLANALTNYVGRPVVDMNGDRDFYDVTLDLSPQDFQAMRIRAAQFAGVVLPPEVLRFLDTAGIDSISDSLRKVGLSLESRRAPLEYLVVDHIEKTPTEN